jgi:uncharacterized protein (TIGR02246 family)
MFTTTPLTKLDADALLRTVDEAWNAGDAAGLARCYTEDGRLIDPLGGVSDGRDQLEHRYAEVFATLMNGTRIASVVEDVRALADDLVVIDGTQVIHNVPTPDGQRLAEWPLHLTAVIRRDGDVARIVEARPYAFSQL